MNLIDRCSTCVHSSESGNVAYIKCNKPLSRLFGPSEPGTHRLIGPLDPVAIDQKCENYESNN